MASVPYNRWRRPRLSYCQYFTIIVARLVIISSKGEKGVPMNLRLVLFASALALWGIAGAGFAQEKGTLEPVRLPPLAHPENPSTPAKQLFGRQSVPAALAARTIGFYSRGCLAGGQALPVNGPDWQVMRLSRNRNW